MCPLANRPRKVLWGLLFLLSIVLLIYPKHLKLEYSPIESLNVFPRLPFFGAFYYLWIAVLVALFLSEGKSARESPWKGLVIVSVFALVYRGIWDIVMPEWYADGLSNIITAKFIMQTGRAFQTNPNLSYLDFPGLHLIAVMLAQVAGMDLFAAAAVLLLLLDCLMASLLFLVCLKILKDVQLSGFATLLALLGSISFAVLSFSPAFLGLVLFSAVLVLLLKRGPSMGVADWFLALLLQGGATVTHFVSAEACASVLLAIHAMVRVAVRRVFFRGAALIIIVVMPIAWLRFYTSVTSHDLAIMASTAPRSFIHHPLYWVFTVARANLGRGEPLWATLAKLYWLFILYGLGTLAILFQLSRIRELTTAHRVAIGAFLGILVLSVANTLLSVGGYEFFRFLAFAPLLTAPFLVMSLRHLARLGPKLNPRKGFIAFALVTILVSFPTFLAFHGRVEQYAYYPDEYDGGRFVSLAPRPVVYSLGFSQFPILRYNMGAFYRNEGQASIDIRDEAHLREALLGLAVEYERGSGLGQGLFLYSKRPQVYYEHVFDIRPYDLLWVQLTELLSATNLIYDNGLESFYQTEARRRP